VVKISAISYGLTYAMANSFVSKFIEQQGKMISPTQFYKCLADDIRLKSLLLIILAQELCVCELMAALAQESQPKVSRHLAQLRKCGLLVDRKQQQWIYYRINPELPDWAKQVLTVTAAENSDFLVSSLTRLNAMGDRPQRKISCCA